MPCTVMASEYISFVRQCLDTVRAGQEYKKSMETQLQASPLLRLPPELRNHVYDYVAYSAKTVIVLTPDKLITLPHPFSLACSQIRQEFVPLYNDLSLAYATELVVCNENFNIWSLTHSLNTLPGPAPGVERKVTFIIRLTNALASANLHAFVKEMSEAAISPRVAATTNYEITFEDETFDLDGWRSHFARLAKIYRFHHSDAEQRVWEKLYWAFAEKAEKIDGVTVREFALGCWKSRSGRFCYV